MYNNSYADYIEILEELKKTNRLRPMTDWVGRDIFITIRHDVEFSVLKALQMASIEYERGIQAAYCFQLENGSYNPFSDQNRAFIRAIYQMGHDIGLHYRQKPNGKDEQIYQQIYEMTEKLQIPVKIFSTHRPLLESDYDKYGAEGIINAYGKEFFEKTEDTDRVQIKYISDSKFRWNYGYPSAAELLNYLKCQIVVHPFQWSESRQTMSECFKKLEEEKNSLLKSIFDREFTRYKEVK